MCSSFKLTQRLVICLVVQTSMLAEYPSSMLACIVDACRVYSIVHVYAVSAYSKYFCLQLVHHPVWEWSLLCSCG